MTLTKYTQEFIARLPLTRPGNESLVDKDMRCIENAKKVKDKFGLPITLWFEITTEFRKYFSGAKEEAAFLAGVAVGWIERGAYNDAKQFVYRLGKK